MLRQVFYLTVVTVALTGRPPDGVSVNLLKL